MKVSELGEFGLIDLLARMVSASQAERPTPGRPLTIGIGDDAAAWPGDASTQLATIDSLIEGVHFSRDTTPWKELGWKSLAVNLSDIAAMGGVPGYAMVSLALPGDTDAEDVAALYEGMIELAGQTPVAIVGGDTCQSPVVAITIAVIGSSPDGHILTRAAARPGEKIAVTGYLGSAAAGLEMLTEKLRFDSEATTYLKDAFLRPVPRLAEGRRLAEKGVAAAIDISDGLLADLRHICRASQVGARVEINSIPIHDTVKENFGERAPALALSGGEDYELLFTAGADIIDKTRQEAPVPVTVIGEITAEKRGEVSLYDASGHPVSIEGAGWEHFRGK
jgi:thiamine-monophosphate kinase